VRHFALKTMLQEGAVEEYKINILLTHKHMHVTLF